MSRQRAAGKGCRQLSGAGGAAKGPGGRKTPPSAGLYPRDEELQRGYDVGISRPSAPELETNDSLRVSGGLEGAPTL